MLKLAPAKKVHIYEPDRKTWLMQTRNQLLRVGFRSTGNEAIDRMAGLNNYPSLKVMVDRISAEDAPTDCQICGTAIDNEFIEGTVKGSQSWHNLCTTCHKTEGRGLGPGLGQHYYKDANGDFIKKEN